MWGFLRSILRSVGENEIKVGEIKNEHKSEKEERKIAEKIKLMIDSLFRNRQFTSQGKAKCTLRREE